MVAWYFIMPPILAASFLLVLVFVLYFSIPSKRHFDLEKKHAVVTGGSKGIGRELGRSLLARGCHLSIIARNEKDLKKAQEELQEYANHRGQDQKVRWYSLDLTGSYDEVAAVLDAAAKELGPVDVLINNAGNSAQAAFEELPIEAFERQMRVNYLSAVYATRAVVPGMQARRTGHISFVSSAAGQCGIFGYTAYAPAKFALRGFADVLHMELLPHKIGVSILYPPNTDTEGFKEELLTMPEELQIISDAAGLASPSEVAEKHINHIVDGEFATTVGFEGWMLGVLTAGAAPERNTFRAIAQSLLAGPFRFVMLLYVGYFNNVVKKCYLGRRQEPPKREGSEAATRGQ